MSLSARRPSRRTLHNPLALERLEDRTLLSGDLLIASQVPGSTAYNLMEYTQQGVQVSSQSIPQAPGATESEHARGLSVGPSGDVNIFDGTASPSLSTLSASTNNWSFQTLPGWSTTNNVTYGEVVAYKNYVFASDMGSSNGQSYGLVRFDTSTGTAVAFAPGSSSLQVTLGLDGKLYELVGNGASANSNPTIQVFDPDTLALIRTFTLNTGPSSDIRSIAVDSSGNVFAASYGGTVAEYNSNGNATGASIQLTTQSGSPENLINIALDNDGQIAVGGHLGEIYLTNESLTSAQTIYTHQWNAFVTFDHYIGTASQTVTPSFSSLAGPTITYGQSSVTLGGQITAGAAFPPGSVNINVAGVTQSAAINPANGTFSATFDTSSLGVSGSPYTITYSYAGTSNYAAITDTSRSLTVNPAVTTLTNLSSPTIVFGTPTVSLSGTVGSNSVLPVGQSVTITLIGTSGTAASGSGTIGSNGQFSVKINTAALAAGSYTIQYAYAGEENFTAVKDTSKSVNITPATTTLCHLSSPTVVIGTSTETLSGTVGSNSVLPVGQSVTVTLVGAKGSVVSGSGIIGSNGSFSVKLNTAALPVGAYTIQYKYAGNANFAASSGTGTLQVTYNVKLLLNIPKSVHEGAALPILLQATDASGHNLSSEHLAVTAISLIGPGGKTYTPNAEGHANPGNVFRYVWFGYFYDLDTRGLAPGTYTLKVKVGNDPVLHAITFVVVDPKGEHGGHHCHHK